jgi:type IV secretory pathway TrbL component
LFGDPDAEAAKRRAKWKERMSAWEAKWKAKKHAKVVAEGDAIRAAYKAKKSAKKKLPGVLGVALFGALAHKDLMEKATGGVKEKVKSKIKENTKYIYSDQGGSAATRSGSFN